MSLDCGRKYRWGEHANPLHHHDAIKSVLFYEIDPYQSNVFYYHSFLPLQLIAVDLHLISTTYFALMAHAHFVLSLCICILSLEETFCLQTIF